MSSLFNPFCTQKVRKVKHFFLHMQKKVSFFCVYEKKAVLLQQK